MKRRRRSPRTAQELCILLLQGQALEGERVPGARLGGGRQRGRHECDERRRTALGEAHTHSVRGWVVFSQLSLALALALLVLFIYRTPTHDPRPTHPRPLS